MHVAPLIRQSHNFSAAVREVLEDDPLRQVSGGVMTSRQMDLLEFITVASPHIDDVAHYLGVTPPAATRAVDRLEMLGLVVRSGSETDRRVTLLTSSAAGQQLVDRYRAAQQDRLAAALDGFDDSEIAEMTRILERGAAALRRTRSKEER